MPTHLFDEDEILTADGKSFDARIKAALEPIFADAESGGYSLWDLVHITTVATQLIAAFEVSLRRYKKKETHVQRP